MNVHSCTNVLCIGAILFIALLAGCDRQGREGTQDTPSASQRTGMPANAIAVVGGKPLLLDELNAYVKMRPPQPNEGDMKDILHQRLSELVAEEVLVREAQRIGIDRDPEIKRTIRTMLTQRLLFDQVEKKVAEQTITEQELRTYYETHIDEFSRPEQIRLGVIFLAVPENASEVERAERRREAEDILAKSLKAGRNGFSAMIRTYSDPHPHHPLGDTGFFDRSDGNTGLGLDPAFIEQTFAIERLGEVHEELVETTRGFSIVLPLARRPAWTEKFEKAAPEVERRIRQEMREKARVEYIEALEESAGIEVFGDRINQLASEFTPKQQAAKRRPVKQGKSSAPPRFPAQ